MKYMGSKARFAKEILPIILKDRTPEQTYYEPFCGGCNVIDKVTGPRIANDINTNLIAMWKALISGWIPTKITKEFYNQVRDNKTDFPQHIVGWVGFNCSYSGKYFGGFAGDTMTKVGKVRDYQTEAINNVLKQVNTLKDVTFLNDEYHNRLIKHGSIIYCDPPYEGTTKYSTDFDHKQFWEWVRFMSEYNKVFVSEYNAPPDFECVWSKEATSSLSANGKIGGNKISVEKLFVYKG